MSLQSSSGVAQAVGSLYTSLASKLGALSAKRMAETSPVQHVERIGAANVDVQVALLFMCGGAWSQVHVRSAR